MNTFLENSRIGIDIDDVLAQTSHQILKHAKNNFNIHIEYNDLTEFAWYKIPHLNLTQAQAYGIWNSFWETSYAQEILPMKDSLEALQKLKANGNELFAITGRDPTFATKITQDWINAHFPHIFNDVCFMSYSNMEAHVKKSDICNKLEISFMFDDSPVYIQDLLSNNISVCMFTTPWNKNHTFEIEPTFRVNSWADIIN